MPGAEIGLPSEYRVKNFSAPGDNYHVVGIRSRLQAIAHAVVYSDSAQINITSVTTVEYWQYGQKICTEMMFYKGRQVWHMNQENETWAPDDE
jgi:hypothetical protein